MNDINHQEFENDDYTQKAPVAVHINSRPAFDQMSPVPDENQFGFNNFDEVNVSEDKQQNISSISNCHQQILSNSSQRPQNLGSSEMQTSEGNFNEYSNYNDSAYKNNQNTFQQYRGKQDSIKVNSDLSRKRSNLNMNLKESVNINNGQIVLNGMSDSMGGDIDRTRNNQQKLQQLRQQDNSESTNEVLNKQFSQSNIMGKRLIKKQQSAEKNPQEMGLSPLIPINNGVSLKIKKQSSHQVQGSNIMPQIGLSHTVSKNSLSSYSNGGAGLQLLNQNGVIHQNSTSTLQLNNQKFSNEDPYQNDAIMGINKVGIGMGNARLEAESSFDNSTFDNKKDQIEQLNQQKIAKQQSHLAKIDEKQNKYFLKQQQNANLGGAEQNSIDNPEIQYSQNIENFENNDQEYQQEPMMPQQNSNPYMLNNKNALKFKNINKGGHLLQQQIINPKNLTSIAQQNQNEAGNPYVQNLPNMSKVQNLNQTNSVPKMKPQQMLMKEENIEMPQAGERNRAQNLIQNLQIQSKFMNDQEQTRAANMNQQVFENIGANTMQNDRQQKIIQQYQDIDREVQDVNNKKAFNSRGRQGRFSQHMDNKPDQNPEPVIEYQQTKKLGMSVKQTKGIKLQSLNSGQSQPMIQPGGFDLMNKQQSINQLAHLSEAHGTVTSKRPGSSRRRPQSSKRSKPNAEANEFVAVNGEDNQFAPLHEMQEIVPEYNPQQDKNISQTRKKFMQSKERAFELQQQNIGKSQDINQDFDEFEKKLDNQNDELVVKKKNGITQMTLPKNKINYYQDQPIEAPVQVSKLKLSNNQINFATNQNGSSKAISNVQSQQSIQVAKQSAKPMKIKMGQINFNTQLMKPAVQPTQ